MKPKFFLAKSIATLLAGISLASDLHALPQGAQVQAGAATFDRAGSALNIRTSDRAIINYQSFNIGSGERVSFIQPGAQSITLNRVTDPNPSHIFGTLTSNGHIVLANPYGIFFESGSIVNVGGLIAGAGRISDSDFLAGRINFSSLSADVENRGSIVAVNDVALYGEHVSNSGSITSQKGSVTLAAGSSVYVGEAGGNIFVGSAAAIPKARVVSRPGVSNSGNISAPKASLVAGDMYGIAIAQSGNISSGDITITAGKGGSVDVSGRLDASNRAPGKKGGKIKIQGETIAVHDATLDASGNAGGGTIILDGGHNPTVPTTVTSSANLIARGEGAGAKGGTVQVTGDQVGLLGNAVVDVSGDAGGGTALIGGDYQGKNPNVQNAERTYISLGAQIRADAITGGDGGKVIVWADDWTKFYGSISARGGAQSGNGGFVETSGKGSLAFAGQVGTGAPAGGMGTLLLDPKFIEVKTAGGVAYDPTPVTGNNLFNTPDATSTQVITPASLNNVVAASVILQANSDVTFTDALSLTGPNSVGKTLTVQAGRSILINNDITTTNGAITMTANETVANGVVDAQRAAGAAVITMAAGKTINAGSANISLTIGTGPTTNFTSGNITLANLATTGHVLVVNNGPTAGSGIVRADATQLITASSVALDVNGAGGGGAIGALAAPIRVAVTNAEARSQVGGVFIDSPTLGVALGGANLGGLTGVSTVAGGDIKITAAGTVTVTENIAAGTGKVDIVTTAAGDINGGGGTISTTNAVTGVTLNAAGGIGVGGAVNTSLGGIGVLNLTTSGAAAAGNITLVEANALNTSKLTLATDVTVQTVSLTSTAGPITLSANIGNATDNLTLVATAGGIVGGAGTASANVLTLSAPGAGGIGSLGNNVPTTATTINATSGSGGVFITETNGADFTATATGAGDIRLTSTSGTLNIAGATATGTGNIVLSSGDDVTLNANLGGAGSGTIAINANTDGTGAQGFAQSVAAGSITTTNATALAVAINVNAAGGGTGGAALRNIGTGAGGTITVATNTGPNTTGGSITQTAATALNVGAAGTITLSVPSGGASGVGTLANNILTTSAGGTLNLTAGSGGAFVTNAGNLTLAAPVLNANSALSVVSSGTLTLPAATNFSTGTGNINLRSNGGTLATTGTLTTTSGTITLAGSAGLTAGHALTTTSGDITLTGGGAGGLVVNSGITVNAGSATITANGGGGAIQLNDSTLTTTDNGAASVTIRNATTVALGNVTAATGALVLGVAQDITGAVTQNANTSLNVGTVTGSTAGGINLTGNGGGANTIVNLGGVTRGGALTVVDTTGGLNVTGAITGGTTTNAVTIATAGGALVINPGSDISATGGANSVSLTGVGITNNATVTGQGGITVNAGTGTFVNSAGTLTTGGTNSLISITANDWVLGVTANSITTGASGGGVTIDRTANAQINLGTNLTTAELGTVTTSGNFTIGSATNTGGVAIAANVSFGAGTPNVKLLSGAGAITDAGGAFTITATNLDMTAKTGVGSAGNAIKMTVSGNLSATNVTSGDIFLAPTGGITLGSATAVIDEQVAGGTISVAAGGAIVIGGNVTVSGGGASTITLDATGTILDGTAGATASGTLTAATVNLGTTAATAVGASGDPIATATANLNVKSSAGAIVITNDFAGLTNLSAQATGGLVNIANTNAAGTLATAAAITSDVSSVTLSSVDNMSIGHAITGPTGVSLTVSGAEKTLTHTAGTIDGTNAAIILTADKMVLSGGTIGNAIGDSVTLKGNAAGNATNLGSAVDTTANTLELSNTELNTITGTLTIGSATTTGAITVSNTLNPAGATGGLTLLNRTNGIAVNAALTSPAALVLTANGGGAAAGAIAGNGAISATLLTGNAATGITLGGASTVQNVTLTNTTSGNISYTNSAVGAANTLTVSGSNTGAAAGGSFTVTETAGALTVAAAGITTKGGDVNLTTQKAGGLLTLTGSVDTTVGSAAGANVLLRGDVLAIPGTVNAGTAGNVQLRPQTLGNTIGVEDAGQAFNVTNLMLGQITVTNGTIIIGDAAHMGNISVARQNAITQGGKNITLINQGATTANIAITGNNDFTAKNLTLSAGGAITQTAGTGKLVTQNAGDLVLNATAGIGSLAGPAPILIGSLAANLSAVNTASGDIVLSTGPITLGGAAAVIDEQVAGGTISVTSSGNITIGGNLSVSGGGASTIILNATGDITRTAGTITAKDISLTAVNGLAGGIGTNAARILTAASGTLTLVAGTGGAFVDNTGSVTLAPPVIGAGASITVTSTGTLTLPAVALNLTGAGGIDFESNGGTLATVGTLTTADGKITLVGSTGLTVGHNLGSTTGNVGLTGGAAGGLVVNAGISVNAGSGTITLNGGGSTIQLNDSTLSTTSALALAVNIHNATTVALGNVSVVNGTLNLGVAGGPVDISGAVTQNANTSILANTVTARTSNNVNLTATGVGANKIDVVGAVALGAGKLTLVDTTFGLMVNGDVTANGGVAISTSGGALSVTGLPGTVSANAGDIVLRSTDSDVLLAGVLTAGGLVQLDAGGVGGVINQTGGSIAGLSLIARAPGNVALSQAGNDVTNLAGASLGGTFSYRDATAVNVGTVNDASPVPVAVAGLTTASKDITVVGGAVGPAGGVAINAAVNAGAGAGGGIVRLQAELGDITQAGAITGGSLLANAAAGSVSLGGAANNVATSVAGSALGTNGSFRFRNTGGINVDTVAGNGITAAASGIVTNNGDVAILAGGTLALNQTINAANGALSSAPGAGTVRLQTTAGDITQTAAGSIVADGLLVNANGAVSLTAAGAFNSVASIAGRANAGTFAYTDKGALTVTTITADGAGLGPVLPIGPLSGVVAAAGVSLTGTGLQLDQVVSATGGTVSLTATTGDITQAATGGVVGVNFQALANNGQVVLVAGAANNNVGTIAGNANGNFSYTDNNTADLKVGTVTTVGVTSTAGDVSLTATNGALAVNQIVSATALNGDVTLLSMNDLSVNAAVSANGANGLVSLQSTAGTVVEPALGAGLLSGNALLARAAVNVDLFKANTIGAGGVAGFATGGFFALRNATALNVRTIAVPGISAGNAVVLELTAGDLTQAAGAAGKITAGAGLGVTTLAGSVVLDQSNAVTGNFRANASGNVTFHNAGAINVGSVSVASASSGGALAGDGITASTLLPAFIRLTSDTGTIGQGAAATARIIGGELFATTTNQDATLANTSNELGAVGAVALGAGKLTLVDTTFGLMVNGDVTANGGVAISTSGGALSVTGLPGTVSANAGDIVLRSTDSDVLLAGVLTAGGLVQLDAGGVGGVINQTGGSIAGLSLIARAPGNVALSQAGNDVTNLAGASLGGTFSYRDATAVNVGTVNDASPVPVAVAGLTTASKDITVVGGAVGPAGGVAINAAVNAGAGAGGGIVRLQAELGDITQAGAITGGSLLANAAAGSVSLGGAANNVATSVAGSALGTNGSFRFRNTGGINVDTVAGNGITAAASGIVTNNGDVAILAGGTLALNQTINAANGALSSAPGAGTVRLQTTAGDITQTAAGSIVADGLLVNANPLLVNPASGVFLTAASAINDVQTLAGRAGLGGFSYQDKNNVTVGNITADGAGLGPVLPIAGVDSIDTTGVLTLTSGGVLNFSVPLILSGSLNAFGVKIDINGGGNPTVKTVGGQTYNNPVELTADAVLVDAGSGDIRFLSTLDSDKALTPRALTVNTKGNEIFNGVVGGTAALASLGTDADAVIGVGGAAQFNMTAGTGAVNKGGVNVNGSVTVNDNVTFNVAGSTLANMSVLSGITGAGGQTYNVAAGTAATLTQDTVLADRSSQAITFQKTVDGTFALTVNTKGDEVFNGVVGGTNALTSLVTDDPGAASSEVTGGQAQFRMTLPGGGANPAGVNAGFVKVNDTAFFSVGGSGTAAPSVQTGGGAADAQVYSGAAVLNLGTVLKDTGGKNIVFGTTVDGAQALEVNTAGNEVFNGVVGGTTALASLVTDAVLAGGQAQFRMTLPGGGANPAGVNAGFVKVNDTAFFSVGGSGTAAPSVQTGGGAADAQVYSGAAVLNLGTVLKDTGGKNIVFGTTVDGAQALEVNTAGNEVFNGVVGGTTALASLVTDAVLAGGQAQFRMTLPGGGANPAGVNAGFVKVNDTAFFSVGGSGTAAPSVQTGGGAADAQVYSGAAVLNLGTVLKDTGGKNIVFGTTVDGAQALEVNTAGNEVFNGVVGGTTALASLVTDAVLAGGQAQFRMTLPGGGANPAGVNAGFVKVNDTAFFSVGGSGTAAPSVQTGGGAADAQVYSGAAVLNLGTVLKDTGGKNIVFGTTVDGAQALEVNTAGNEVFNGVVGGTTALASLVTDAVLAGGQAQFRMTLPGGGANPAGVNAGFVKVNDTAFFSVGGSGTAAPSVQTGGGAADAQVYSGAAVLNLGTVLKDTGGKNIVFGTTVDGAQALEVNTAGNEVFNGVVGGTTALASLVTDAVLAGGQAQFRMDMLLAPGAAAGVNVTGKVTVNDSVVFNALNGSNAKPTVRTGGGQEYNLAIGTVATVAQDAFLTDTAAQPITFRRTLDGPQGLTVNTGGATTFAANIGQTLALASLSTDAPGTTILPMQVTTTGSQDFRDAVTLTTETTLKSTAGGALNLFSTVNAAGHALELRTAGTATLGATISNLTALNPYVVGTTTIGTTATLTDITVPNELTFPGPVVVLGNVVIATNRTGITKEIANSGAALQFSQTVNGPGSLTANAGGVLAFLGTVGSGTALDFLSANAPIIHLNSTRTQNLLKADAKVATDSDGSDGLVNLLGNTYTSLGGSVQFNPTNRATASKHATILSTVGNLDISAAGSFFMGNEQKLLVNNGSLTITAGGSATVGDMAAFTNMKLTASSVFLQGRALSGFYNSNRKDNGLGFVSPTISFSTSSMGFLSGTTAKAVFSTRDSIASVRQIAGVSLEIDKDIANQFSKQDLKVDSLFQPVVPNVVYGTVQPIASGTRVTEPGQIQVVFVLEIPKLVELPQDTFLSKSDQDVLAKMGIYPREATDDENITVSLRRGVFRQPIEGKAQMDDPEYKVVVNRLTTEEIKEILRAYMELAGKEFENLKKIATTLAEEVNKYQAATPGALGLEGFTKWLQAQRGTDKSAEELSKNLDELASVFVRLARIGLTKKEVMICKLKICDELKEFLPNVEVWDVVPLVEGGANPPPQAPRPALTVPPPDAPSATTPPAGGVPAPLPPPPESTGPVPADPAAKSLAVPLPPAPDASAPTKVQ